MSLTGSLTTTRSRLTIKGIMNFIHESMIAAEQELSPIPLTQEAKQWIIDYMFVCPVWFEGKLEANAITGVEGRVLQMHITEADDYLVADLAIETSIAEIYSVLRGVKVCIAPSYVHDTGLVQYEHYANIMETVYAIAVPQADAVQPKRKSNLKLVTSNAIQTDN